MTTCAGLWTAVGMVVTKDFHVSSPGGPQSVCQQPDLWTRRFPVSVANGTLGVRTRPSESAPEQGAGTPLEGLADRKDTTDS